MILYLRYCRTAVLFHITVHVKDQFVTTYDDVILVKPNRICTAHCTLPYAYCVLLCMTYAHIYIYTMVVFVDIYGYPSDLPYELLVSVMYICISV